MDTRTMVLTGIGVLLVLLILYFTVFRKPVTTPTGLRITDNGYTNSGDYPSQWSLSLGFSNGGRARSNRFRAEYYDVKTNAQPRPDKNGPLQWSVSPPGVASVYQEGDDSAIRLIPLQGGSATLRVTDGKGWTDSASFSVIAAP